MGHVVFELEAPVNGVCQTLGSAIHGRRPPNDGKPYQPTSLGMMTDVHGKCAARRENGIPLKDKLSGRREVGRLEVAEGSPSLDTGRHRGQDVLYLAQYVQLGAGVQIAPDQRDGRRDLDQSAELGSGAHPIEDGVHAKPTSAF